MFKDILELYFHKTSLDSAYRGSETLHVPIVDVASGHFCP